MSLPTLTGKMFIDQLKRTRDKSATGIDQWDAMSLKLLPPVYWEHMANIFNRTGMAKRTSGNTNRIDPKRAATNPPGGAPNQFGLDHLPDLHWNPV